MKKRYTAEEMREMALVEESYGWDVVAEMLRHAADILDGILKEIDIIEKMPTADLDGSFANQKVNGERLMAKIAFYQKVKKIVEEVRNDQ